MPLAGERTHCYLDVTVSKPTDPTGGDAAKLAELCHDFAEPVGAIVAAAVATDERPYYSPIEEVLDRPWVRGRIALLGDAAHAMSPNMAQGAGMAPEDALVIAETIARNRPLAAFEARRRPRIDFVRTQTNRRDNTRSMPALLRDTALRLAGRRIFHGNYAPLLNEP